MTERQRWVQMWQLMLRLCPRAGGGRGRSSGQKRSTSEQHQGLRPSPGAAAQPPLPVGLRQGPSPLTCFLAAVELRVLGARDVPARQEGHWGTAQTRPRTARPSPSPPPLTSCPSGAAACPCWRLGLPGLPGPRRLRPARAFRRCAGERRRRGNSGGGRSVPGPCGPGHRPGNPGGSASGRLVRPRSSFSGLPLR